MTFCNECNKETKTDFNKFSDVVHDAGGEYIDVYVASCSDCKNHKSDETWVE